MFQEVTTGNGRSPFLQRRFLYLVNPTGEACSYARVRRGLLRNQKPNGLISSSYALQQQQSGKKRVMGSGENRQWVHSCAEPAENPQVLKMKHEKAALWVCDCSVQCVVLGSLAERVRLLSTQRSPMLQLQSKEIKYVQWHIQKQGKALLSEAIWFSPVLSVVVMLSVTHCTRVPLSLSSNLSAWHLQSNGCLPNIGVGDKQICYVTFQLPGNVMIFDSCCLTRVMDSGWRRCLQKWLAFIYFGTQLTL